MHQKNSKQQVRKPKRRTLKGGSLASDAVLAGITPAHMCRMYSALPEPMTPAECAIKAAAIPAPVESGSTLSHAAQSVASGVTDVAQGAVHAAQSAANAAEGAAQGVWNAVGGAKKRRSPKKKQQKGGEGCPFAKKPILLGGSGCAIPVQAQTGGNGCAIQPLVGGSSCSMHRVSSVLIGGKKEGQKKKKGGNRRSRSRCLLCQSASCFHLKQEKKQEGGADAQCIVNAFRLEQNLPYAQYANLINPDNNSGQYSVVMAGGQNKKKKTQKAKPKRKAAPKKKASAKKQ